MEVTRFEPNYDKWLSKKSIKFSEAISLACGLCPLQFRKWIAAYESTIRNKEQAKILEETQAYMSLIETVDRVEDLAVWVEHLSKEKWNGEFKTLVDLFYSFPNCSRIDQSYIPRLYHRFLDVLRSVGQLPEYVDKYKDAYFRLDYSTLKLTDIKDEDAALAVIFGTKIEPFKRWLVFASGNHPSENRNPDDIAFWKACRNYFGKGSKLDDGGHIYHSFYNPIKALKVQFSCFESYIQALYNEGVIFSSELSEHTLFQNIKLEYQQDSWAFNFYREWLDAYDVWTLEEAELLFKGDSPKKSLRNFIDLSQGKFASYAVDYIKNKHTGEFDRKISEVIQDSIDAGNLRLVSNRNGVMKFMPHDIVKWFLEKTEHKPPKPLLILLGLLNEEQVKPESLYEQRYNLMEMQRPEREKIILDVALKICEQNPNMKLNAIHEKVKSDPTISDENILASNWSTYLKPITKKRIDLAIAEKRGKTH